MLPLNLFLIPLPPTPTPSKKEMETEHHMVQGSSLASYNLTSGYLDIHMLKGTLSTCHCVRTTK